MNEEEVVEEIRTLREHSDNHADNISTLNLKIGKLENKDKCNDHISCMERMNENMKRIELTYAETKGKIDGFVSAVNDFIAVTRKDIYEKDGLMSRVGSQGNQVGLQWGLLGAIVVAVILVFLK